MRTLLISLLLLFFVSSMNGCREKKSLPPSEPVEMFREVITPQEKNLKRGRRGGVFIRADIQELDTLNIVTTRSKSVYAVLKLVFESLLSIHPITGMIQGGIAKDYSITNNGFSILLHLNSNVRFSDGTLCTAEDVVFSFEEIYMNPDVDSKITDVLKVRDKLISLSALDDSTVRIDLPVPYRPFLYTLTHTEVLPKHIIQPILETGGVEAFNKMWGNIDRGIEGVIGTGPYRIKDLKKGEYVRFTRNPFYGEREGSLYLEDMPYLDEIIELLDIDNETEIVKFQIGEIDFYDIRDYDIASGDIETLLSNRSEGKYSLYCAGQTLRSNHFLAFNQNPWTIEEQKRKVFQNPLFRRAISHLIDRKRITDEIYKGYAYRDMSPERNVSPFYKNTEQHDYDPEIAARLFSRLNLKDIDGDGFFDLPSGKPFGFSLITNEDHPLRVKMGELIAADFEKAGIRIESQPAHYDEIVTKLLDTFDWEAVIIGIVAAVEPNEASWVWESKGTSHLWYPYQEHPNTLWEKRIDELFALGRTTWDFKKAKTFYNEYQQIITRELPVINIVIPAEIYGYRDGFENLLPRSVTYNAIGLMPYIHRKER